MKESVEKKVPNEAEAKSLMELELQIEKLIPVFTESERNDVILYHSLSKEMSKGFEEEALEELKTHPVWGPMVMMMSKEMMEASTKQSQELQDQAINHGNWKPYIKNSILQGKQYADMGIAYKDWLDIVLLAKKYFARHLEENYKHDFEKTLSFFRGMNLFVDHGMYIIGDSYLEEERKKVAQKKEEYTHLLELKNVQLVDFCNIVSHNLRAPLMNIVMLIDFIEQSNEEEERKEVFSKVKPVVNHLSEVLNELIESVQIRQDSEVKFDEIKLKEAVSQALKGFETELNIYKVELTIDIDKDLTIHCPKKYLDSILSNLISNAIKYKSPDRTLKLKISASKSGENVVLAISDNGLGIDLKMHKDHIFKIRKVFHKHPEAKGFGLFLIKTQVDAMDGKIWVESTPDVGSTFFVEFIKETI